MGLESKGKHTDIYTHLRLPTATAAAPERRRERDGEGRREGGAAGK